MKKPDRFEREAIKVCWFDIGGNAQVSIKEVTKLLRKEHAWVVRMVKSHMKEIEVSINKHLTLNLEQSEQFKARHHELSLILDQLTQRKK